MYAWEVNLLNTGARIRTQPELLASPVTLLSMAVRNDSNDTFTHLNQAQHRETWRMNF